MSRSGRMRAWKRALSTVGRRLLIVGLVFVSSLALGGNRPGIAAFIHIPADVAAQFFSAVSQAVASLLGILAAFLILTMSTSTQRQDSAYDDLRDSADELLRIGASCPPSLREVQDDLGRAGQRLRPVRLHELPTTLDWWPDSKAGILEKLKGLMSRMTREDYDYLLQTSFALAKISRAVNQLNAEAEARDALRPEIGIVAELSVLLLVSLVLVLAFGTVDVRNVLPDLALPIIASVVAWLALVLFETVLNMYRRYAVSANQAAGKESS